MCVVLWRSCHWRDSKSSDNKPRKHDRHRIHTILANPSVVVVTPTSWDPMVPTPEQDTESKVRTLTNSTRSVTNANIGNAMYHDEEKRKARRLQVCNATASFLASCVATAVTLTPKKGPIQRRRVVWHCHTPPGIRWRIHLTGMSRSHVTTTLANVRQTRALECR